MEDNCWPSGGLSVSSRLTLSNFGIEKIHKAAVTFQKIKTSFKEGEWYECIQEAFETD